MSPIAANAQVLNQKLRSGRAVNAVADLLRHKLTIPNIFLQPASGLVYADVLAVDRAGSGDLHAVEIKLPGSAKEGRLDSIIANLKARAVHFQYLATTEDVVQKLLRHQTELYADDGIGRLGLIVIAEHQEAPPHANLVLAPERFRVAPTRLERIEKQLLAKKRPDMEIRI